MFDVSFSELMLIGVIALIVIGPERLPKVARTVGHLLGRAQRYVNEVKSDIQKEMDLKEIGDIKHQMEDAARSVQSSMTSSVDDLKAAVTQPTQALKDTLDQARQALDPLSAPADAAASGTAPADPAVGAPAIPAPATERTTAPAPEPVPAPRPAATDTSH
ncbi:Sec-independent protein translocase protein TatB [Castellaniella sp. WN]